MLITNDGSRLEHEWTVEEYFRLGPDVFGDRRTELIGGKIYDVSPQGEGHADLVMCLNSFLVETFGATHYVRVQLPIIAGRISAPEPDFALLPKSMRDPKSHPKVCDLLIEVADSSLGMDLGKKASLYASSGIVEYWVINLKKSRLEVFRGPESDSEAVFGASYREKTALDHEATIRPVSFPHTEISVRQLLEPA